MSHSKIRARRRKNVKPGSAPGQLRVPSNAPKPVVHWYRYDRSAIEDHAAALSHEIPRPKKGKTTWINVVGLGDPTVIRDIGQRFGIHPLALEDVVNTHQRPKLEAYDGQLYIVLRMPNGRDVTELEQVSIFVGEGYVLTWQEREGDCFDPIRKRLKSANFVIRQHGSDFLAYALIDAIVDSYFAVVNDYNDLIDEHEQNFESVENRYATMRELHQMRSSIRILRRATRAHHSVVHDLLVNPNDLIGNETQLHLRDVSDHATLLTELLDNARDTCTDLQDLQLSMISMRMNEVMKVLTIIATIFIPLGFIAGLYGMNFSHEDSPWNMPETRWYFGYPFALAIMLAVAIGMVIYFRRRGWLG